MFERVRGWLRPRLAQGFWYPSFRTLVGRIHSNCSLGHRFKRWLAAGEEEAPQGASELYQAIILLTALLWAALLRNPPYPVFAQPVLRDAGIVIAAYFILELFVFSVDWIFVAEKPLESYRRSLATFLVSLVEVAVLFFISFSLAGCYRNSIQPLLGSYQSLVGMASLQLVPVNETALCTVGAHFERLLAAVLMLIIVASLVGAVVREQKGDPGIGSET
jgi:hypothetical protein